jgi:hypothetical protein
VLCGTLAQPFLAMPSWNTFCFLHFFTWIELSWVKAQAAKSGNGESKKKMRAERRGQKNWSLVGGPAREGIRL